ncbi:MAG: lipopolysaccharide assembly protein LapA domain-containing protein [Pseudonocardia sp.]|nr:lipopolysaccharide assembly protein LapA domain-containing protein [Pseudonocardia sp.]
MSEDPTRAMALPGDTGTPVHGRVGQADPHADPATNPGLRPADIAGPDGPDFPTPDRPESGQAPTVPTPTGRREPVVTRTRTGGLWTGLILSALVLVVLLVFILQNLARVQITFLGLTGSLPLGVALLLAAVAGLLLVAIPGGFRILQLRRAARRVAGH